MSVDPDTAIRVRRLEQLVEHLYRQLGQTMPEFGAGVSAEVQELARSGNVIGAIKRHREETGTGLAEAKAEVDRLL